jgi:SEC-C motif-containing protein
MEFRAYSMLIRYRKGTGMDICPCGSKKAYNECCGSLIRGERQAQTAEELMRSRYSAYVKKEMDYVFSSLHPAHRSDYDERGSRAWADRAQWHGIEIIESAAGGPADEEGRVEFVVSFTENGIKQEHHERAEFKKHDGTWYFTTGTQLPPKQVVRAAPKTGRNDACSCGSGKKYKKCCGR